MSARDAYTTLLCSLNRRKALRRFMSRVPILWRVDGPIKDAMGRTRRHVLEAMPKGAVCAEIGVWKGDFSDAILRVTRPRRLHLVDPWAWTGDDRPYGHQHENPVGDAVYSTVKMRFEHDDRVTIHRATSGSFLASLEAGSLDWIYIDGDHHEPAVAKDLELAWRAVRPGGFLMGDDYYWRDGSGNLSVRAAVQAFCRRVGAQPKLFGGQFVIGR